VKPFPLATKMKNRWKGSK